MTLLPAGGTRSALVPILLVATLALAGGVSAAAAEPPRPARPNFVVILVDDLGWSDLGCQGSDLFETPHIDRLAQDGVRFATAYAVHPVCSPTRAGLLTGRHPARLHVTDWIPGANPPGTKLKAPDWTKQLVLDEITFAEALRAAGWKTAHVGKWHLGPETHGPLQQGFQFNLGGTHVGQPPGGYFAPERLPIPEAKPGEYLTDVLTERACRQIADFGDDPFCLYFAHYTVHTPLQAPAATVEKYRAKIAARGENVPRHANPTYAAMVESLDRSVGRMRDVLRERKLADRTVILLTSDNGGLSHLRGKPSGITSNAPLRRGKGSCYEGGVRVPLIALWPGTTPPGSVCETPAWSLDVLPTVLEIAGIAEAKTSPPRDRLDGRSLVPLLKDPRAGRLDRDTFVWHYPHYHAGNDGPTSAIRIGDRKLVRHDEDGRLELFDLSRDPGETHDLSREQPDQTQALARRLDAWLNEVGAQRAVPNLEE